MFSLGVIFSLLKWEFDLSRDVKTLIVGWRGCKPCCWSLKTRCVMISRVEVPDSFPDFEGRTASGYRPKLHCRAESLSLESLDMSHAVGRKSLDIPKFWNDIMLI